MSRTPMTHYNSTCLKCDVVNGEMVRWGALIFCESCFELILPGINWATIDWNLIDPKSVESVYSE